MTDILLGGFVASIVWFFVGGALYMNPVITKIYNKAESHPGYKKWDSKNKYVITMYFLGGLLPSLLLATVYYFINQILPGTFYLNTLYFGLILIAVRIIPRLLDMWLQSSYPNKLLTIELVNGSIGSFVVAGVFTWLM